MPAKAITFSRWKLISLASLIGVSAALIIHAHAQEPQSIKESPSSTAPAYGGAATEGGPGSQNAATGERVPEPDVPLTSGGSDTAAQSNRPGQQATLQPGQAQQQAISNADRNLIRTLAQTHLAEVDMAKMAQSRSQDMQVRSFAQRMIDDHGTALDELKKLAETQGVILPGGPDKKHVALKEKLTAMTGEEFTQNYLTHAGENAHREAHQLLQQAVQSAQDPTLKAHANKSLALVEQHLQMAGHLIAKTRGRAAMQSSSAPSGQQQGSASTTPPPQGGVPAAPGSAPR